MLNNPGSSQGAQAMPRTIGGSSLDCTNQATPPSDIGVSSALKELVQEIYENARLGDNIKNCIGISVPDKDPTPQPDISLFSILRDATYRVRRTNEHLGDILRHLTT